MKLQILFFSILFILFSKADGALIKGKVIDAKSREALIGVSVFNVADNSGTTTDLEGNFSLETQSFPIEIRVSYLGYATQIHQIDSFTSSITILLQEENKVLDEFTIKAEKSMYAKSPSPSAISIQGSAWQSLPAFGGESDIVSLFMTMPGIKKGGDGSGGMLVRGGSADQNNVFLNGIPVYQNTHIISFYSPFQPELIESATLYKGSAPANYGGRLASVLSIQNKEPDSITKTEIGLGLLLAKIHLSTALNSKTRISLAARRSAQDLVWPIVGQNFPATFYDMQFGLYHRIDNHQKLELRYFRTFDNLKVTGSDIAKYKESEQTLLPEMELGSKSSEEHLALSYFYQKKKTSLVQSFYTIQNSSVNELAWTGSAMSVKSKLNDFGIKGSWKQQFSKAFVLESGYSLIYHRFLSMEVKSSGDLSGALAGKAAEKNTLLEHAVYVNSSYFFSSKTRLESGLRLSQGRYLEPRLNLSHDVNHRVSLSAGIERNVQFIQKVSSSSTALPIDVWYPIQAHLKPQTAWQAQTGVQAKFGKWNIESEVYYKRMNHLSEYAEGSLPLQSNSLAQEIVQGKGKAYGLDAQLRYESRSFSVWANYSLSWSKRHFADLNEGLEFYDRWDRRHDINFGIRKHLSKNLVASASFHYTTGARYTPRIAQFIIPGVPDPSPVVLPVFAARNSLSLSAPHRIDLSLSYTKAIKKGELEMQLGVYNLYNSLQSFRVEVLERQGKYVFREVGLFGMMPSAAIKWKF